MSATRVAVVTGSNKGIGLSIVKALCSQFQGDVILTSRDEKNGKTACSTLNELGLSPKFHQLDITDKESVKRLAEHLKTQYGGLDLLVNNAGLAYKVASTAPPEEKARVTVGVNFFGTLDVCHQLFPLLRPSARVVHVASQSGLLRRIKNVELESKLSSATLAEDELVQLAHSYIKEVVEAGEGGKPKNWPHDSAYSVSKALMIALAKVQARDLASQRPGDKICINACCPGYVATDMSSHKGPLTPDQGAETPVMLSLLPDASPTGDFYYLKKVIEW